MQTHLPIIITLFMTFAVVAFVLEMRRVLRSNQITIMFMCRILYIVSLAVLPALVFWGYLSGVRSSGIRFEDRLVWTFYVMFALTLCGYLAMNFGYSVKQRQIPLKPQVGDRRSVTTSVVFLIISGVSLVLWASAYGGVESLLEQAEWIRASAVDAQNSFTFFKRFVFLCSLASYALFYLLLTKAVKGAVKKLFICVLLAVSMMLSFIYLQANDGRLLLAVYLLLFFMLYFRYQCEQKQTPLRKIIPKALPVLIIATVILFNAEAILNWMRGTQQDEVIEKSDDFFFTVTREFSFIVSSAQMAITEAASGEGKLMIANDVVNGLFAWLPFSLKPVNLTSVWAYNTQLVSPGISSTSPTSIVAQSVYDLGFLGILVIPVLFGMIIKKAERILDSYGDNVFAHAVYVALGYNLCKLTAYFSIYNFMIGVFYIFLGIVVYWVLQHIKSK